jgi:hypothetical protein
MEPAIMGIEEGEDKQAKGVHNILSKKIAENFPNLKTDMPKQKCSRRTTQLLPGENNSSDYPARAGSLTSPQNSN